QGPAVGGGPFNLPGIFPSDGWYGGWRQALGNSSPILHVGAGQAIGVSEHYRPGKEERHFHIKNHKQQGNHVITEIELDPGAADGGFAAFVDGQFLGFRPGGAEELAEHQVDEQEEDADAGKDKKIKNQLGHGFSPIPPGLKDSPRGFPVSAKLQGQASSPGNKKLTSQWNCQPTFAARQSRHPARASAPPPAPPTASTDRPHDHPSSTGNPPGRYNNPSAPRSGFSAPFRTRAFSPGRAPGRLESPSIPRRKRSARRNQRGPERAPADRAARAGPGPAR